ncbi:ANTAR domain-containing protein [Mycolicibacterium sp. BiH015]|uniref:ANTAR domain-containing protein n=1 Tax=Mycolicibacterium sp. BiH015 TaxID=3018808 RepID=UPI0022E33A83|nr:ANTAR domain-containing protein [Mycolicibacterium sp. BiH015]MDA2891189.1 ANTAR domain-containing protein [Mycolicibacterium sp. BiH015]
MLEQSQGIDRPPTLRRNRSIEGRRTIDLAQGILIGQRRCSPSAAFAELLAVSRRHHITLTAAAEALVDLAIDVDSIARPTGMEAVIAEFEWGGLFGSTARAEANARCE